MTLQLSGPGAEVNDLCHQGVALSAARCCVTTKGCKVLLLLRHDHQQTQEQPHVTVFLVRLNTAVMDGSQAGNKSFEFLATCYMAEVGIWASV